jgi:hypothetical protein
MPGLGYRVTFFFMEDYLIGVISRRKERDEKSTFIRDTTHRVRLLRLSENGGFHHGVVKSTESNETSGAVVN